MAPCSAQRTEVAPIDVEAISRVMRSCGSQYHRLPASAKPGSPTDATLTGFRPEMSGDSEPMSSSVRGHRSVKLAVRSRGCGKRYWTVEPAAPPAKKSSSTSAANVPPSTLSTDTDAPTRDCRSDIPTACVAGGVTPAVAAGSLVANAGTSALFSGPKFANPLSRTCAQNSTCSLERVRTALEASVAN